MSSRGGRRRGRPPKSSYAPPRFLNARSSIIEKPKWLQNREGIDNGGGSSSHTPNISRASSPGGSVSSFSQQYSAKKHISVTPFKKRGRKAGTRGNRGGKAYVPRPSLVVTRGGDYHYGSDFDSNSDSEHSNVEADLDEQIESDVDIPVVCQDEEGDSIHSDSEDSDFSLSNQSRASKEHRGRVSEIRKDRIPTPLPYWLQDREIPKLELPKSAEDLLLPPHQILPACAIYEVLRKFSQEVRLSPFRLEDFLAALQSQELTSLLAEVHVMLLKAMLREEDAQQTWFGPLDQKDSTNSMLHFSDTLTWPEVLRVYLQSDHIFAPALDLLEDCEYPFTSCDVRLQVLKFLTDQFICNTAVRQDILSEGNIKYDDHCRVCYKVGDLLCCETCPAVYHLHCLDPPLEQVPNEDWQCPVCTIQQCRGVTDCKSDLEKSGLLCRQDCLGYDRHGRKYWFVARRVFVEESGWEKDGLETTGDLDEERKVWYYSAPYQFEQLLGVLDRTEYERDLCRELYNLRPEIFRQMNLTLSLTNEFKGNNKSYLEIDEAEAAESKIKGTAVKKEEEDVDIDDEEPDDENGEKKENGIKLEPFQEKVEAEEVVEECGVEVDDDFMQQLTVESEKKELESEKSEESTEDKKSDDPHPTYATRSKTGSIVPRNYVDMKRRPSTGGVTTVAGKDDDKNGRGSASRQSSPTNVIFKLGMEGRHKSYVNQYSSNSSALNKVQAAEERDRKRYLSHKFSLTGAAEFKWVGSTFGNRTTMLHTIRATLLQLHSQLLATFMHPNWGLMRKPWISAVNACVSPRDLGRALSVLAACIRPVAFTSVWHESLGHVRLQRQTAFEREEKKKVDKKEKKEKELEEEMHRLHTVHYTRGLKHQIWKQKGEEYRLHAQWGWRWLSATRPLRRSDARQCGLRAGPWRVVTRVQEDNETKWVQSEPLAAEMYQIEPDDPAMDLVDVSAAMNDPDRRVYSKVAKKAKLDALLEWRVKLKETEEKQLAKEQADKTPKKEDAAGEESKLRDMLMARKEELELQRRAHVCYSADCGVGCYSPTCRSLAAWSQKLSQEEEEKQKAEAAVAAAKVNNNRRIYSAESTEGPVSLKRVLLLNEDDRAKKKRVPVKYPMMSPYMTKSKKRTIFVLADHELRHLARRGAQGLVAGFHHGSKNNSVAWFYPSARPVFKTCWFYRTTGLQSLSAAALQLRILWASLRWDDMAAKSSTPDGKSQLTTDTEIVTTEILKHRNVGRFLEKTQYFRRRVVIPLDVPKTVREVAPSRSGLRKRKLVEAPKLTQPLVSEEWVDEDKLELWEIRQYHERAERVTTPVLTRLKSGTTTPTTGTGIKALGGLSMEEMKEKAEQQLRAQRAAHQQKTGTPGNPAVVRLAVPVNKVAIPGTGAGTGRASLAALISSVGAGPRGVQTPPGTRRILVTKEGSPIVRAGSQPVLIAASPGTPAAGTTAAAAGTPAGATANKIQITRGADGKIQIRGLQPGQQLMRLSDGRFTIVQTTNVVPVQQQVAATADGKAVAVVATTTTAATTTEAAPAAAKTVVLKAGTAIPAKAAGGQLVVAGNTANIVQQLTSGKLQLATLNGQQVLISGQAPNIPAGGTVIATTAVTSTATTTTPVVATATVTAAAGTTPAQPKQALVLQSPQGTRIVVQNFQGGALTPQQLSAIQEQLKTQMQLRAQGKQVAPGTVVTPIAVKSQPASATATSTATPTTPVPAASKAKVAPASNPARSPEKANKFVVTPDFIQQTIRKALKQENLNPEIEQKLLHLQRFQERQKKDGIEDDQLTAVTNAASRKRTISDAGSWNEEFETPLPAKPAARKVARVVAEPSTVATGTTTGTVVSAASSVAAAAVPVGRATITNEEREAKARERSMKAQQRARERRMQQQQARLQGMMVRNAEQLKKDMLRKRALLEKELRMSIQKEISALKVNMPSPPRPAPAAAATTPTAAERAADRLTSNAAAMPTTPATVKEKVVTSPRGQKRQKQPAEPKEVISPSANATTPKKQRTTSGGGGKGSNKKKLYCVCRTPYDNSKFYVGCDLCSNWFHGSCVGITEAMSQTMSEFVCDSCNKARDTQQLYCLCQQPYDESQFYICCDKCQDWFHGRCVGVLQAESESIDEYTCPRCDPDSPFNYANMRTLSAADMDEIRKMLRQLQTHKSAWPFREPVSTRDAPDYYRVIKDPMDLRTIDSKLQERRYKRLSEFIGDVTKIFDNCRYYNAKESNIARCANTLEAFFGPKLKILRSSLANT